MMKIGDTVYTVGETDGQIFSVTHWRVDGYMEPEGFRLTSDYGMVQFSNWLSTYNKNGVQELIDNEILKLESQIQRLQELKSEL